MAGKSTRTPEQIAAEKSANFVKLINPRMTKVLAAMKGVKALAAKTYTSSEAQQLAIVATLQGEVDAIKAAYTSAAPDVASGFSIEAATATPAEAPKS